MGHITKYPAPLLATLIDITNMTKIELREHLRKVFTTVKVQQTEENRICFDTAYLGAKDGTDEKRVQQIVSKIQYDSGLTHDFSYTIASDAVDILAELDDWDDEDAINEQIDSYVPIYTYELMQIYVANSGAVDEAREEYGTPNKPDTVQEARIAWYKCIQDMVQVLREQLTDMLKEQYRYDPAVCPSSLGEDELPMDENETGHKWDEDTNPVTCAECGATKDANTAHTL